MDEVFGHQPSRPTHPDYWKLVAVVLGTDGAAEAGENVWKTRLGGIDLRSLRFVAGSRSKSLMGLSREHDWSPVRTMGSAWLDGFLAGYRLGLQEHPDIARPSGPRQEPDEAA